MHFSDPMELFPRQLTISICSGLWALPGLVLGSLPPASAPGQALCRAKTQNGLGWFGKFPLEAKFTVGLISSSLDAWVGKVAGLLHHTKWVIASGNTMQCAPQLNEDGWSRSCPCPRRNAGSARDEDSSFPKSETWESENHLLYRAITIVNTFSFCAAFILAEWDWPQKDFGGHEACMNSVRSSSKPISIPVSGSMGEVVGQKIALGNSKLSGSVFPISDFWNRNSQIVPCEICRDCKAVWCGLRSRCVILLKTHTLRCTPSRHSCAELWIIPDKGNLWVALLVTSLMCSYQYPSYAGMPAV